MSGNATNEMKQNDLHSFVLVSRESGVDPSEVAGRISALLDARWDLPQAVFDDVQNRIEFAKDLSKEGEIDSAYGQLFQAVENMGEVPMTPAQAADAASQERILHDIRDCMVHENLEHIEVSYWGSDGRARDAEFTGKKVSGEEVVILGSPSIFRSTPHIVQRIWDLIDLRHPGYAFSYASHDGGGGSLTFSLEGGTLSVANTHYQVERVYKPEWKMQVAESSEPEEDETQAPGL